MEIIFGKKHVGTFLIDENLKQSFFFIEINTWFFEKIL